MVNDPFRSVSLGDIADFRNGKAISPERYSLTGKNPVFGSNGQIARTNDVLNTNPVLAIGRVGAYCGSVHYLPQASWVTDNAIVTVPKEGNDLRFLFYLLSSLELRRTAIGSAQPLMTQGGLKVLRTMAPPLAEQKAIAQILGSLDDKIELNRRMNATLEAMARALFQNWFVDFDPVRAKIDGCPPVGLDAGTAALFPSKFQDSALGHLPLGWTVKRLPDAIDVNPRRTLKAGTIAPYLDMKNMPTQGHCAEDVVNREFSSGTKFQNGDTLLARITPCLENGKTAFVDFLDDGQIGWGSTEYIVFAPKPPLPPHFNYFLARSGSLRSHAIHNMTGSSGRQRVPSDCFESYLLAVPGAAVAHRFDCLTAPLMARIKSNTQESRTLATLRDTLLPRLLSGELRPCAASVRLEPQV